MRDEDGSCPALWQAARPPCHHDGAVHGIGLRFNQGTLHIGIEIGRNGFDNPQQANGLRAARQQRPAEIGNGGGTLNDDHHPLNIAAGRAFRDNRRKLRIVLGRRLLRPARQVEAGASGARQDVFDKALAAASRRWPMPRA